MMATDGRTMTAVLHTADVHLREDAPERLEALRSVLELAERLEAEVLTIGGDLFDRPRDVEELRGMLRGELFSDRPFDILLIPGNHDVDAFRRDIHFGESCITLLDTPYEHHELEEHDLRITGVPYTEEPVEEVLLSLAEREPFDGIEALLLHCTFDIGFQTGEPGDEEEARYFPVTADQLSELGFDCYLAGHFHNHSRKHLERGTFVYPGTPASTSTTETNQRRVVELDPDGDIGFHPLDTFHYASTTFSVLPGSEEETFERIRRWVDEHVHEQTEATVTVEGFHSLDEKAFHRQVREAGGDVEVSDTHASEVSRVQAHPIYKRFEERLKEHDLPPEEKDAVRRRMLEAFVAEGGAW